MTTQQEIGTQAAGKCNNPNCTCEDCTCENCTCGTSSCSPKTGNSTWKNDCDGSTMKWI